MSLVLIVNLAPVQLILMSATIDEMKFRDYFSVMHPGLTRPELVNLAQCNMSA